MHRQQFPKSPASPLSKLVSLVLGIVLLALGLMFSVVLLGVLVVAGLGVWGYLWWKTRELRRVLRERPPSPPEETGFAGEVFEGEATVVETTGAEVPAKVGHAQTDADWTRQ
jgi:hypothetical protein